MRTFIASFLILMAGHFLANSETVVSLTALIQMLIAYLGFIFGYVCCVILDIRDFRNNK